MNREDTHITEQLAEVVRREHARVSAALIRGGFDVAAAADALQDACLAALQAWTTRGAPARPAAWLLTAARRAAIDAHRRDATRARNRAALIQQLDRPDGTWDGAAIGDLRVHLLFACCHPALPPAGRVALALHALAGLGTDEVARLLAQREATVAQQIVRARRRLRACPALLDAPPPAGMRERLPDVLAVLGRMRAAGGALADEALRLARLVHAALGDLPS